MNGGKNMGPGPRGAFPPIKDRRPGPRGALSILIYHRVLARPDPLFPDQVDVRQFERHLRLLSRFFNVLPLADAVARLRNDSLPPRAACITFDDGYADNEELALPLLQRYALPACFFIATGYLDGGQMWNDKIIERIRHSDAVTLDLSLCGLGRVPVASIAEKRAAIALLLRRLKYLPSEERDAIAARLHAGQRYPSAAPLMLRRQQVQALHRAGMAIGGHTVSHPILAGLSDHAARADIANGKRTLEQLTDAPVTLFAYPNGEPGVDYGPAHVQMLRELGFAAAVATHWGAARVGADPYQLPRFTPWDHNPVRFLWRMMHNLRLLPMI